MKTHMPRSKPRNPLVVPSRLRHAGSHQLLGGARRQQNRRALQRELNQMKHSP